MEAEQAYKYTMKVRCRRLCSFYCTEVGQLGGCWLDSGLQSIPSFHNVNTFLEALLIIFAIIIGLLGDWNNQATQVCHPPPFLKDFERAELEREHKCVGGGGFYLFREFGLMERQMARV